MNPLFFPIGKIEGRVLLVNSEGYTSPTPQWHWETDITLHGKHTSVMYE